jgi:quercetin dioxygenase-like cupin family protein
MQPWDWATAPAETVYPGIQRQTLHAERQTVVRYVYQPGSVFPHHAHPQEQVTLVISGTIEFTVAGQQLTLRAGQAAVIPPDVPHGARVVGDAIVESFNTLSPARSSQTGGTTIGSNDL